MHALIAISISSGRSDDKELRRNVVARYHDFLPVGHPGHLQTMNLIQNDYWWPEIYTFIKNYMDGCAVCQQSKINQHLTSPPLVPIKGSPTGRPFAQILMDFITKLSKSHGYDSIMVVVDHGLMKGVILCPCNKTITAKETAELLLNNVYKCFGLPDKVISDQGPQFASKAFRELGKQLGINLTMSTAYHPQTNGATEQSNQEIEAYLCIFCGNNPEQWSTILLMLEFSYNQKPHAKMLKSLFYLMYGENPMAMPIVYQKTNLPSINN